MAQEVRGLESHAGYWLRFVSNHVSHAFRLRVESHGVTVAEWVVLRTLFDEASANPSRVADTIGMTRGAISKLVDRLAAKGLVRRRAEKADRRYQAVALSASGRRLVPVLAALANENDQAFFGGLSEQEREGLVAALKKIVHSRGLKGAPVE